MNRPLLALGWLALLSNSVCFVQASAALEADSPERDWAKERSFWSFRPPRPQGRPVVHNARWPRRGTDYFILASLEEKGLAPAREASKRTLIRRVTLDLTGLPATPSEIDAFLADERPDAYARLVQRLLDSPRFGERLASLWLPLARYAEDQAHQVGTDTKHFYPNAWRYRTWVIQAFNRDLPYDEFVRLQLAADQFEGKESPNLVALGFLGLGPKYYDRDRLDVQADEWEDRVDTVARAMLGLTVACARCHDHKFDPITTRDYYSLAGVFANTRLINRRPDGSVEGKDAQGTNMSPATLHIVEDQPDPKDLPIFQRGKVDRKGPVIPRGFLQVLSSGEPLQFKEGSGRRELAGAITSPDNPLTARVWVNRLWGHFFGKPLVATPSNFGHSGLPPTQPALLDDLAVRFMENGWSIKWLANELVCSATYRQECRGQPNALPDLPGAGAEAAQSADASDASAGGSVPSDPENDALSHMNRRRLSVEQWRDSVLFVSGELEAGDERSLEVDDLANHRRTVYSRISRLKLNDLLMQFDYPDANVHAEKRSSTITAIQKLFFLNSPFMMERAGAFARRVAREAGVLETQRVTRAYVLAFGREPTREESQLALEFLAQPAAGTMSRWEQYAQLLLVSNELLYVD